MNYLNTLALVLAAYLAVFLATRQTPLQQWLGVQIDLLPSLMVYCGLTANWAALSFVAVAGGLWFDSLSANQLGISILPLFLIAFFVHLNRSLILGEERYAQFILGAAASAAAPALSFLLLIGTAQNPLIGWGSIGQWIVMGLTGGALTPLLFWVFDRFNRAFNYQPISESSFRPDREIKRGRI